MIANIYLSTQYTIRGETAGKEYQLKNASNFLKYFAQAATQGGLPVSVSGPII